MDEFQQMQQMYVNQEQIRQLQEQHQFSEEMFRQQTMRSPVEQSLSSTERIYKESPRSRAEEWMWTRRMEQQQGNPTYRVPRIQIYHEQPKTRLTRKNLILLGLISIITIVLIITCFIEWLL